MVAVKVTRTSDNNNDAKTRQRDDANDANDDADGEGQRRTDDAIARRRRGVVLTARLRPATTAPRHRDDDDGR